MKMKSIRGLLVVAGLWFFQVKVLNSAEEKQTKTFYQENASLKEVRTLFATHVTEVYDHLEASLSIRFMVAGDTSFAGKLIGYLKKNYSMGELAWFYAIKDVLVKFFMALCDTAYRVEQGKTIAPAYAAVLVKKEEVASILDLCRRDTSVGLGVIFDATTFNKKIEGGQEPLLPLYYSEFKEALTHFWTAADLKKLKNFFTNSVYSKLQAKGGLMRLFLCMVQPADITADTFIADVMNGLAPTINQIEGFLSCPH